MKIITKPHFYYVLIVLTILLYGHFFFINKNALKTKKTQKQNTSINYEQKFLSEDEEIKKYVNSKILFFIFLSLGISINVFALFFIFTDRKKIKNFFKSEKTDKISSQPTDLLEFFVFSAFVVIFLKTIIHYTKLFFIKSPITANFIQILSASFIIQAIFTSFIFILIKEKYGKYPKMTYTPKNFPANFLKSTTITLGVFPWTIILFFIGAIIKHFLFDAETPTFLDKLLKQNQNNLIFKYLIIYSVIGAPFFEETIFRGFIYNTLKNKLRLPTAVFLTSAIFATIHYNFLQMFYIFGLGIALCLIYEATGSLFYPILIHSINNAIAIYFSIT